MKSAKIFLMITAVSVILTAGGSKALAWKGYGTFVASNHVTEAFDRYQSDSNLNYYFCGNETFPDAIIGVDKGYTLDSGLWKKIALTTPAFPTTPAFQRLITDMQRGQRNLGGANLHGFAMLDDNGKQIGVWYSTLGLPSSSHIKMTGGKGVQVQTVGAEHASASR